MIGLRTSFAVSHLREFDLWTFWPREKTREAYWREYLKWVGQIGRSGSSPTRYHHLGVRRFEGRVIPNRTGGLTPDAFLAYESDVRRIYT